MGRLPLCILACLGAVRAGSEIPMTIALRARPSNEVLCLDVPGAVAQNPFIDLWECNGHANQLFYFDAGSYSIRYAAVPTKCIDAGDPSKGGMAPGALLMLWDCNGLPQQQFGYDWNMGTIYLSATARGWLGAPATNELLTGAHHGLIPNRTSNASAGWYARDGSGGDIDVDGRAVGHTPDGGLAPMAAYCIDAYSDMKLGNHLQVWGCNGYPQQAFDVNLGTTIRVGQNYKMCIDVILPTSGSPQDGALLQLWGCNGHINQQFIFDANTGQIKYGGDPSLNLCIDASGVKPGMRLKLWDCNGVAWQQWGYDATMNTLYLSQSMRSRDAVLGAPANRSAPAGASARAANGSSAPVPDATICLDLYGGLYTPGNYPQTWGCNLCWNQKWLVGGGVRNTRRRLHDAASPYLAAARAPLPPLGTCPPIPDPGGKCSGGWPSYASSAELSASPWGAYFTKIYGAAPPDGADYPFCIGNLWVLYSDTIAKLGIKTPKSVGTCPTNGGKTEGQVYNVNNNFSPQNMIWIWHPYPRVAFKDKTWVEVIHMGSKGGLSDEHVGSWFFYAKGSGMWFNIGKTITFIDHGDAYKHFGAHNNEDMCGKGAKAGFDSIQFTAHTDCEFNHCNKQKGTVYMNYEIVSTKLVGIYSCASKSGTSPLIKSGWEGSKPCTCSNAPNELNCNGIPVKPVAHPHC